MTAPRFASAYEPNVTPMLDVLLVLLVAFMTTIQARHAMDVQLPPACVTACGGTSTQIVLEVLPGNQFRLNHREVDARQLATELEAMYRRRNEKTLYVAGYPGARYQDVITAMDVARSAGVRVIGVPPKSFYPAR